MSSSGCNACLAHRVWTACLCVCWSFMKNNNGHSWTKGFSYVFCSPACLPPSFPPSSGRQQRDESFSLKFLIHGHFGGGDERGAVPYFGGFYSLSLSLSVIVCSLWFSVVVCGCLWWSVVVCLLFVVCGGLWLFVCCLWLSVVVCGWLVVCLLFVICGWLFVVCSLFVGVCGCSMGCARRRRWGILENTTARARARARAREVLTPSVRACVVRGAWCRCMLCACVCVTVKTCHRRQHDHHAIYPRCLPTQRRSDVVAACVVDRRACRRSRLLYVCACVRE